MTRTTRSHRWRAGATLTLALLILTLPLARHWETLRRPPFDVYYEFTSILLYVSDITVVIFLSVAALWAWRERPPVDWEPAAVTIPLALLPPLALSTALWAGDSTLAVYVAARLFILLAVYLAIVTLRPATRAVRLSLAGSLLIQTAVAVAQFLIQDDLGWRRLGEIAVSPMPGEGSIIKVGERVWLRAYGLTPHPNILGGVLVVMLLTLAAAYLRSVGWRRLAWLMVLTIGGGGLVLSFSRAAWLGGVVGGALLLAAVLIHQPWRQRYGRAVLVPAAIGVLLVGGFVLARPQLFLARLSRPTSYEESRSLSERTVLTNKSLELIRRHPLTGVGAGNFSTAVKPLVADVPNTTPQPVHNVPLLLASELGVAGGALLWVWLMIAPLVITWRRFRAGKLNLWTLGLTMGLLALTITDLFDFYSWGWPQGRLLRWTYLGLWAGTLND